MATVSGNTLIEHFVNTMTWCHFGSSHSGLNSRRSAAQPLWIDRHLRCPLRGTKKASWDYAKLHSTAHSTFSVVAERRCQSSTGEDQPGVLHKNKAFDDRVDLHRGARCSPVRAVGLLNEVNQNIPKGINFLITLYYKLAS